MNNDLAVSANNANRHSGLCGNTARDLISGTAGDYLIFGSSGNDMKCRCWGDGPAEAKAADQQATARRSANVGAGTKACNGTWRMAA